ncbi:hypothetical protein QFC20_006908 [Naganishia adeliensis]|uniref:Uncharacterized protein n=1 Tax=Naganishia adeliensis TaxID=92952 RepID=A0ACC2V5E9_9TREE|nr:hypothetical protein QFC20_006908 [Naganishia adeliensis]
MPSSIASDGSAPTGDDHSDTSSNLGAGELPIARVREVGWGFSSLLYDPILNLSDVGDPQYEPIVATRVSVVSSRGRFGGGKVWSSVMFKPSWIADYSVRTLCDSFHSQHDQDCSFEVVNKAGGEGEDAEDIGYYFRLLKLFPSGGRDRVPIKHFTEYGQPTSPYSFSIEALRHDAAQLAPRIYTRRVAPQSPGTDFRDLWTWMKHEALGVGPVCAKDLKDATIRRMKGCLEETLDEDDRTVLDRAIEAIADFNFASGFGPPIKLVRRS